MNLEASTITAILTFISGVFITGTGFLLNRKKIDINAADQVSNAQQAIIDDYKESLARQNSELKELRAGYDAQRKAMHALEDRLAIAEREIVRLTAELATRDGVINDFKSTIDLLTRQNQELIKQNASLLTMNSTLKETLNQSGIKI